MRYLIEIAYNGKNYHGWQKQQNAYTVQEELDLKLSLLLGENIETIGCGRTDTGVHAKQFFAHFDYGKFMDPANFTNRINQVLPGDIAVYSIREVNNDFNARFDADYRVYEYWITQKHDPFLKDFAWYQYVDMDLEKMNDAASLLLTHKNFECFSKVNTDVSHFLCEISYAMWRRENSKVIFTIRADRFLRNMVRTIVGTLIEVGKGKMNLDQFTEILESKNRCEAGQSVPAHGLYLTEVQYKEFGKSGGL